MHNIKNTIIECPSCGTNYSTLEHKSCFNCDNDQDYYNLSKRMLNEHNSEEMLFM